ncbi:MAG: hypothetical protein A3G96_00130 [Gammaproteobacteria bacterium RIFCSPLOWO2_12_FULL_52_10]|nr:MAG: hypothetical protein A3G96_00130 [Gammaproteobacteria bacterium RIFCSPLOWO2_12_FULL_52_10]
MPRTRRNIRNPGIFNYFQAVTESLARLVNPVRQDGKPRYAMVVSNDGSYRYVNLIRNDHNPTSAS